MAKRGPKKSGNAKKVVTVRVAPDLYEKLQEARKRYPSMSACIEDFIENGIIDMGRHANG